MPSEEAKKHFRMALAVNPSDASAENGLGGIALHEGDFDEAIRRCARAAELNGRYLFAFHDLTLAYYQKIQSMKGQAQEKERQQYLLKMLESYKKVLELDGQIDAGTLPPAARDAVVYYGTWALSEAKRITG